jgi:uncharacterized SAM-binding protein YcdF (DUF218 family)
MSILRPFASFFVQIDLVAIVGIAIGIWLVRRDRRRAGLRLLIGSWIPLALVHLTPAGRWLLVPLEERFPRQGEFPAVLPEDVTGLVLLGGSFVIDLSEERREPIYNLAGARLFDFLALARQYPKARIVFTGTEVEAKLARRAFEEHGIDAARATYEDQSLNTADNARNTKALVAPKPGEKWALVTSALHMPRSVGLFRGVGWEVIPCPVNFVTTGRLDLGSWFAPFGGTNGLSWRSAMHEWIGLVYHRVAGESRDLFPGP